VAAIVLLAIVVSGRGSDSPKERDSNSAAESAGSSFRGSSFRGVIVFKSAREPSPSQSGTMLRTRLVSGRLPSAQIATVRTDEDCAPDEAGISHCLNKLELADGSHIVVRHSHDMNRIPCLSPGEQVNIRSG
jgi:hypothetical protein